MSRSQVAQFTSNKPGLGNFRAVNLSNALQQIKTNSGNVYGWNIINPNTEDIYVKFFDEDEGATLGTDAPVKTIFVPGEGTVVVSVDSHPQLFFENRLEVAATGALGDTDNTSPTSDLTIDVSYA